MINNIITDIQNNCFKINTHQSTINHLIDLVKSSNKIESPYKNTININFNKESIFDINEYIYSANYPDINIFISISIYSETKNYKFIKHIIKNSQYQLPNYIPSTDIINSIPHHLLPIHIKNFLILD